MSLPFTLNTQLESLAVYQPGRPILEVAREHGLDPQEVIKLASNENPLGPSPKALAAMKNSLDQLHLYPDGSAYYLKQKLAEHLGLNSNHLIFGNGSNEIIEFIGHALLNAESEVIVSQYCFAVYPLVTALFGATLVEVPAVNYGHDLAAMLRAVTPKTRVMFVANPNNPTGTIASRADVVDLINQIPPHVLLVLDEAYIEFLRDGIDLVPLIRNGLKSNILLMRTFSKVYGLAGLRLGYGIGHPDLISAFEKIRQPFNINSIAQAGALAALDDLEHLEKTLDNNAQGLAFFERELFKMKIPCVPSSANFILVRVGAAQQVFIALQKKGVITRPMGGYQLPEFIRISVGTPKENARCINTLREVLAGQNWEQVQL